MAPRKKEGGAAMRREKEASLPFFSFVSGCKGREREKWRGKRIHTREQIEEEDGDSPKKIVMKGRNETPK